MTHEASRIWVLVVRERRVSSLFIARERSRGLLLSEGFRDRAVATRAKARISHPKMGGTSRLLASQGRECVSSATAWALGTRLPSKVRIMRHHIPSHKWGMHRCGLFLLTPPWAREDSISPRLLHKHLLFRRQATWARA